MSQKDFRQYKKTGSTAAQNNRTPAGSVPAGNSPSVKPVTEQRPYTKAARLKPRETPVVSNKQKQAIRQGVAFDRQLQMEKANAVSMAEAAEKEYQDYLQSEEYLASQNTRTIEMNKRKAMFESTGISSNLEGLFVYMDEDQKEKELREKAEFYRAAAYKYEMAEIMDNIDEVAAKAEKEYQEYLQSDEYRQWEKNQKAAQWAQTGNRLAAVQKGGTQAVPHAANYGIAETAGASYGVGENEKEKELRSIAEYYRQLKVRKHESEQMEADLEEMKSWTPEEQQMLIDYVNRQQMQFYGSLHKMAALPVGLMLQDAGIIADAVSQKYGGERASEMKESYNRLRDQLYGDVYQRTDQSARALLQDARLMADPIFQKYGTKRVNEIAESFIRYRNEELAKQTAETAAAHAGDSGFWASVGSVAANVAGTVTGTLGYREEMNRRLKGMDSQNPYYETLDPNNIGMLPATYAGTVRGTVSQDIEEGWSGKVGSTVYQAGMSALDNLARVAIGGGSGSLTLAAMDSFGRTVNEFSAQGATPTEAIGMGIVSAGLEVATEKVSMDNLLKDIDSPKKGIEIARKMLRSGAVEVSEEEISFFGSVLAEAAILREKSSYNQRVAELQAYGLSREQAIEQANVGVINEAAQTMIQSFLSGNMMAGITAGYSNVNKLKDKAADRQLKQTVTEAAQTIRQEAPAQEGSAAQTAAPAAVQPGQSRVTFREGTQVDADMVASAERISAKTGRQIEFYTADSGEDGYYSSDGVIHVNTRGADPMAQIISHELTHSVEKSDVYKELNGLVLDRIRQKGGNLEQLRQQKRQQYAEHGQTLETDADVDSEIVASYIAKNLLTSEQEITRLARENPTLAQKIMNWLDELLGKLGNTNAQERTFVRKARDAYARALEGTGGAVQSGSTSSEGGMSMDEMKAWADEQYRNGDMTEEEYDGFIDEFNRYMEQQGADPMAREDNRFREKEDSAQKNTANEGGAVKFSIANTSKMSLDEQLRQYNKGNLKTSDSLYFGETPSTITKSGLKELPLAFPISNYKKSTQVKHNVPRRVMKKLNENLGNALFSFSKDGRIGFIIPDIDGDGKTLLVGIEADVMMDRQPVNVIRSIYGLDNPKQWIQNQIEDGKKFDIYNEKGANSFLQTYGYSASVGEGIMPLKMSIQAEERPVKKKFSFSETADQSEETPESQTSGISRETLPAKARDYLKSAERKLLNNIGKAMSVPYHAKRESLQPIIQEISDEYLKTGTVSREKTDELFERAYQEGVVIDREFYDQYKHIKDHLRTTAVTLSQQDQADIADFRDFRSRANRSKTLRIVAEGGLPVDTAYQELQSMAPELFPDSITHPADQLQKMFDVGQSIAVSEASLDSYYGRYAAEYKKWQKNDFEAAIQDSIAELKTVRRYADDRIRQEDLGEEITLDQAEQLWKDLKDTRKTYQKASAKNLLTARDEMQVGRLLRGEVLLEDLEGEENFKAIKAVYEAKEAYEQVNSQLKRYKAQVRAKRLQQADSFLETANTWKDKKTGIAYSRETMRRNILDIVPDKDLANRIVEEYFEPVHANEAQATKFKTVYRDRVRALGLSSKMEKGNLVSEAHAVQLLGEAMDNIRMIEKSRGRMKNRDGKTLTEWRDVVMNLWNENPGMDKAKIENAVQEFRKIYDELFVEMNRKRMENGYEPVNYRQGYFPHFQPGDGDGIMQYFGRVLGINVSVEALPTTINGLTHTFKPGIQWFGNAQERLGFNTAYDALEGFDKYIEGVSSVIHHTDDIQRLRAFATRARYRTSDEGIRLQVDQVMADPRLTEEEKQMKVKEIYEHGRFALSNFAVELDEYTNLLANKKSKYDRTMESLMGRRAYTIMKNVESKVGANMIAGNLGSAFTNFIPLTQAWGRLGSADLLKGMKDTAKAVIGKDSTVVDRSDFLTNRRGSDVLVKGWQDKLSDVLGAPMEIIDNLVSESIVRGAYYQNLRRGMSDSEAMHQADIFAAGVMADRSKGALPTLFESSNPLFKAFTQFQVEVNNQYSEVFKDIPREYAGKAKWMLAACLFKYFIGAWLWNKFEEEVRGRASAMDPIGIAEDFIDDFRSVGLADAGANLATNLIEELPFTSALSLLGFDIDGGRIPIASAMPDIPKLWESMTDRDMNRKQRWKNFTDEIQKPITYLLMPAGGGQAAKIWKGIDAYIQGGSYSVNGEGEDILQYPVYKDDGGDAFWSLVRSTIFGKSSLPEAQEWVKDGFDSLTAKQTAIYQDMLEAGAKDREAYTLIDELRRAPGTEAGEKRFNQLDILKKTAVSDEHKAIAYYGMVASQSERELMNALTEAGSGMDIVDFVAEFSDAKKLKGTARKEALRDALKRSTLTEAEKQIAIGDILGTEQTSASGNLTQYGKFIYAKKYGLTADEFMDMYAKGIDIDDYIDLREQNVSNNGASDLAGILGQLELSDISSTEKWNRQCEAILAADVTEEEKVTALVNVSSGSTARMLRVGYDYGISPDLCISFRKILPKFDNGNGNYSQKEVQAAIDALSGNEAYLAATGGKAALTIEQKAILWQLYNTSWKYWKNPYSSEVGRFIYELMQAEKNAPAQKEQESSGTFEEAIMEQWRQK